MPATLYGANVSPFVRKVRIYLAEKAINHEIEPINPFDPPADYRDISPLGKIPAWRDGDVTLADSSVICLYLERTHPQPALYPADNYAWARALWFEEFIDAGFVPKAGGNIFFPLIVAPRLMNQPVTDEVRAGVEKSLNEEIRPMWQYLEDELGDNEFFVDNRLTMADIAIASIHVNLDHAGIRVGAEQPRLAAFVERMFNRPSISALLSEERPMWAASSTP